MKEFCAFRAKAYAYLHSCFENHKHCLFNNKIILKSQQRF